jgi:hypothetical protein
MTTISDSHSKQYSYSTQTSHGDGVQRLIYRAAGGKTVHNWATLDISTIKAIVLHTTSECPIITRIRLTCSENQITFVMVVVNRIGTHSTNFILYANALNIDLIIQVLDLLTFLI